MAEVKRIEPTVEEARNGWDAASLTKYVREREAAQAKAVFDRPPVKPRLANGKYSPHRWRGAK